MSHKRSAVGTGGSVAIERCEGCDGDALQSVLFLGYLPPVTTLPAVGSRLAEQPAYPAQMLRCPRCGLVQSGCSIDPHILFAPNYPYLSGTTRALRENFAELAGEVASIYPLGPTDRVIDIGSNDGTLLACFAKAGRPVLGIEPTNAGKLANERGIPTHISFFNRAAARLAVSQGGPAKLITATNVFAHVENVHEFVRCMLSMLADDGIFAIECRYLPAILQTIQYDSVYHEHLRHFSVGSLQFLLDLHGMEIIHAKPISTHGGSIRIYASRKGARQPRESVAELLAREARQLTDERFDAFRQNVVKSKLGLLSLLNYIKGQRQRVYGIGAPSRACTLINYVGLDDGILDCVLEIAGSSKIGKYVPGTMIPIEDEARLFSDQPDYALLLSWHVANELIPKLQARGYRGKFIVPLPEPRIVEAPALSAAA